MQQVRHRIIGVILIVACAVLSLPSFVAASPVPNAGSLIKCPDFDAVYYVDELGRRNVFPNSRIFFTHYEDFRDVVEVSCKDLSSYPIGRQVQYAPGMRLIKSPSVNEVFFVSKDGVRRPIRDEAQALELFGPDWASQIDDISEVFLVNYPLGDVLSGVPDWLIVTDEQGRAGRIIDGKVQMIDSLVTTSEARMLRAAARPVAALESRVGRALTRVDVSEVTPDIVERQLAALQTVAVDSSLVSQIIATTQPIENFVTEGLDLAITDLYLIDGQKPYAVIRNLGTESFDAEQLMLILERNDHRVYDVSAEYSSTLEFLVPGGSSVQRMGFLNQSGTAVMRACVEVIHRFAIQGIEDVRPENNCFETVLTVPDERISLLGTPLRLDPLMTVEEVESGITTVVQQEVSNDVEESDNLIDLVVEDLRLIGQNPTFTVRNAGTVSISDETELSIRISYSGASYIGQSHSSILSRLLSDRAFFRAGGFSEFNGAAIVDPTLVVVCVDAGSSVTESNEFNNCAAALLDPIRDTGLSAS